MDGLPAEKIRGGKASAELITPIVRRNPLRLKVLFNLVLSPYVVRQRRTYGLCRSADNRAYVVDYRQLNNGGEIQIFPWTCREEPTVWRCRISENSNLGC